MDKRQNTLKAVRFERPDYIPMQFVINPSCWNAYPQNELFDLMESHSFLFPDFKRPNIPYYPEYSNVARTDQPYTDDWGCLWETICDGITGTVVKHPLDDWSKWDSYTIPDPKKCMGIQVGPMLSPGNFRQYIAPCYRKMLKPAKEKGTIIHMHSDGDIRTLIPDLLD